MRFSEPPEEKEKISIWQPKEPRKNLKRFLKIFVIALVVVALVVLIAFFGKYIFDKNFKNTDQQYSAVFLTNGQVYFGKMVENNEEEIVLNNVYYIQVNANTTPEKTANALNQTSFNLVKLGNELHGPTDQLFINRSQVVFYEYLRDDSKVVESIKNYR